MSGRGLAVDPVGRAGEEVGELERVRQRAGRGGHRTGGGGGSGGGALMGRGAGRHVGPQRGSGPPRGERDGGGRRTGGDGDGGGQRHCPLPGTDGGGAAHLRGPQGKLGARSELVKRELQAGRGELQREPVQRDDMEQGVGKFDDLEREGEHRAPQQLAAVMTRVGEQPALQRRHPRRRIEDVEAAGAGLHHQVCRGRRRELSPEAGQQAQDAPLRADARVVKGLGGWTHSGVVVRSAVTQDSTKV